jgi:hypothetical protein
MPTDRDETRRRELTAELDAATAARARAIHDKLTAQLAASIASARAAERDKLEQELAEAIGIPPEQAAEFGWQTLIGMVYGIRSIADVVIGTALPEAEPSRRLELLKSFGAADYWARVRETAERDGAQWRQMLGLRDDGRPMGDEGVTPGSPLEAELNATLDPLGDPGAPADQGDVKRP